MSFERGCRDLRLKLRLTTKTYGPVYLDNFDLTERNQKKL